ncbi:hypothetical protein [Desulfoferrobacter suflitae]|uniref:hypothetical protein n=1 Tax=Desulfoferrobacter suflitae TaxID=2865782 RepID=UPI0021646845|nr:hypothetical protein [Desulfoferrobacter suflitae]MCK8602227.1 hypothetical protein [Desulfoferrobacter suflitae]
MGGSVGDMTRFDDRQHRDKPLENSTQPRTDPGAQMTHIKHLVAACWSFDPGKPVTAEELLDHAGAALLPLFHTPPIGPIPAYLEPHHHVHQCVAEYEERLEELDRWKARQLCSWLRQRVGDEFMIQNKAYRLHMQEADTDVAARYWLQPIRQFPGSPG